MSNTTETEKAVETDEAAETEAPETEKRTAEDAADESAAKDGVKAPEEDVKASGEDAEEDAEEAAPAAEKKEVIGKPAKQDGEGAKRGLAARLDGGVALTAALVVMVASLVASVFLWNSYSSVSDELDAQKKVRTRSAEFARAFLLYEDTDLDGWEKRLTALAAPDYRSAISQAVKMQFPVITNLQADSEVTIREVFVNDFEGSVAKAVVVADTRVSSKDFVRTATGMRLLVELNLKKDQWLVNGVGVLGIDDETMTDAKGNEIDPSKIEVPGAAPTTAP